MPQILTKRLQLEPFTLPDAPFVLELLNSEGWLEYIGNRNVNTEAEAAHYIQANFLKHYQQHGFGLYACRTKDTGVTVGTCGLIRRDQLPVPDLGFAFLPQHQGLGYAHEAATGVLAEAKSLNLPEVLAITLAHNTRCVALLKKLKFEFDKVFLFQPGDEELELYRFTL